MKKLLSVILCAIFALSALTPVSFAADGTCGEGVSWSFDTDTGVLNITGSGAMDDYGDYEEVPWSPYMGDIVSVVVEDGVTRVGNRAFIHAANLSSITLPESLTFIGDYAFAYCSSLTGFFLPGNSGLGEGAFSMCKKLERFSFPYGAGVIPKDLLRGCEKLKSVDIQLGCWKIEESAFYDCVSLESIEITGLISSVGDKAFGNCIALKSAFITGCLDVINDDMFWNCPSLKDITYDGEDTEWDSKVDMGDSESDVLDKASLHFWNGDRLRNGEVVPPVCGDSIEWLFDGPTGTLYVTGTGEMYDYSPDTTPWHEFSDLITNLVVSDGITRVGDNAFAMLKNLRRIVLPNSLITTGIGTFSGCASLRSIDLPEGMVSVNFSAFSECRSLEAVTIPEGFTYIDMFSFCVDKALVAIKIPVSLKTIDHGAFDDCSSLRYVIYAGTEEDFAKINIESNNQPFLDAEIFYAGGACPHVIDDSEIITEPTYTTTGEGRGLCLLCGRLETEELPRIISDISGDATGDGEVDMKDVLVIRRVIAGLDELDEVYEPNARITGGDEVSMKDVLKIRRIIAGLE